MLTNESKKIIGRVLALVLSVTFAGVTLSTQNSMAQNKGVLFSKDAPEESEYESSISEYRVEKSKRNKELAEEKLKTKMEQDKIKELRRQLRRDREIQEEMIAESKRYKLDSGYVVQKDIPEYEEIERPLYQKKLEREARNKKVAEQRTQQAMIEEQERQIRIEQKREEERLAQIEAEQKKYSLPKGYVVTKDVPEETEKSDELYQLRLKKQKAANERAQQKREESIKRKMEAREERMTVKESREAARQKKIDEWKDKKRMKQLEKERKASARENNKIKKEEYGEYTLGKDDVITISVRRHPEFSGAFPLGPNGKIQYPFVGDIDLGYLTKSEAREKITDILSVYVTSPEVDITITAYNSKTVYVLGSVAGPGKYSMRAEFMPVREALLAAGLPRENITALRRAVIVRPMPEGKAITKKVNLLDMLYNGNLKLNYDLRSGDIVYVPATVLFKVTTVLDQVLNPAFKATSIYDDVQDVRDDERF